MYPLTIIDHSIEGLDIVHLFILYSQNVLHESVIDCPMDLTTVWLIDIAATDKITAKLRLN